MTDDPTEHVITVDASCSCGASLHGAWSGAEVDEWHDSHQHETEGTTDDR